MVKITKPKDLTKLAKTMAIMLVSILIRKNQLELLLIVVPRKKTNLAMAELINLLTKTDWFFQIPMPFIIILSTVASNKTNKKTNFSTIILFYINSIYLLCLNEFVVVVIINV